MKIEFFLRKKEHPYYVEFLNKNGKNSHEEESEEGFLYFSFASVSVKKNDLFEDISNIIDIFIETLCSKFPYIKKEKVLYKFIKE